MPDVKYYTPYDYHGAVGVMAPIHNPMDIPHVPPPAEHDFYEMQSQCNWWPISNAAYGTVVPPGDDSRQLPFILPSMPKEENLDLETQRSIMHFNYVLSKFYSEKLLPMIYTSTGRLHSFNQRSGPIYVNAKQYRCILRRRIQRAKLLKFTKGMPKRKKYLHESRHRHATNRLRNSQGRFVSKVKAEKSSSEGSGSTSAN